jgi:hypothetical protein
MKTKILFIITLMTVVVQESFSQTYFPMLNNSSWNIQMSTQIGPFYYWIEPGVDVVIGSYTYKKFLDVDFNQTEIYVREDVTTKRVYRRISNIDVLMCDFSLQVGNTITLGNGNLYSVAVISNIDVNGGQRRVFTLQNLTNPFIGETWIEGVGNRDHPLRPQFEVPTDPAYNIICSYQNGVSIYNFGLANGGTATNCPTPALSIENHNLIEQKIIIFPNPFSTETILKSTNKIENGSLEIFNSIGQKVREFENINANEIVIKRENLENGIYLLVLKQNQKIFDTKKIILN